ncbi:ABC transporter permease [Arcanobacterium bovis]|nr:FtsX-like permease family protein [Arcanobacterium bovis]
MLTHIFRTLTVNWRSHLLPSLALIIASIFIFLEVLLTPFLNQTLEQSVAKTTGQIAFSVSDESTTADALAQKLRALPEVESVYSSIHAPATIISGSHAIDANINNLPPEQWSIIDITRGERPTADNQVLISGSIAKALGVSIGEEITVLGDSSFALALHKLTVTGIFSRSPFSSAAQSSELLVNSPDAATGTKISASQMGSNDALFVVAKPHVSRTLLQEKIKNLTAGTVLSAQEIRESVYAEQARNIAYFQSILGWLLALPMLISAFVIAASTHSLVKNRRRTMAQLRTLGASRWYIFGVNMSEVLIISVFSTAIGHAIGRSLFQVVIGLLKSGSGGAFISQDFDVVISDYLFAALGSIGVALIASLPSVAAYSFVPASFIFHRETPRKRRKLVIFAIELIVFVLGTIAVFFSIVVPEDLLFIIRSGNNNQYLRVLTTISLLLLAAIASFYALRFVVSIFARHVRFSRSISSFHLAATQHYADAMARIGTLLMICAAASILGLTTMSSIKATAYQESESQYLPFDAAAKIIDPTNGPIVSPANSPANRPHNSAGFSESTLEKLAKTPGVDQVLPVETVIGKLGYNNGETLENFYLYGIDPDSARKYFPPGTKFLRGLKPGTIVLPRDLLGLPPTELPKQATLTLSQSPTQAITLYVRYENVPWSIITTTDLKDTFGTHRVSEAWARFSTEGNANKAATYQATINVIKADASVRADVVLSSEPVGIRTKNTPASYITLGLLTLSLILCVAAVCNSLYLSRQARSSEVKVLSGIGISPHVNSTSLVVSAIGRTTLSVFVGSLAGVTSGIYLATVYVGALTWRQFFSIPWISVVILTLICALLAGICARIQTALPSFTTHYGRSIK